MNFYNILMEEILSSREKEMDNIKEDSLNTILEKYSYYDKKVY